MTCPVAQDPTLGRALHLVSCSAVATFKLLIQLEQGGYIFLLHRASQIMWPVLRRDNHGKDHWKEVKKIKQAKDY